MRRPLLAALTAIASAAAAPAHAQSRRYPPEPVDKDDEAANRSGLWEAATNPQRTPYDALVAEAQQGMEDHSPEALKDAIVKLGQAIKLLPDDERAYRLRGDARLALADWAGCAADFQATLDRLRRPDVEARSTADLRRRLGTCLARAGQLADAERVLADAAATGHATGELWLQLGQVRIALGKLDEAISALEAAKGEGDVSQSLVRWLLAGAYDRARRPADALDAGQDAWRIDHDLTPLKPSSGYPLIGAGESEYLLGLAWEMAESPRPELATLYFRRFVTLAPESPWRRRAHEHLRELDRIALPEQVEQIGGNAAFDRAAARAAVRRFMPQLRACAADLPEVLFEVDITKIGPRSTTPGPRLYVPPAGAPIRVADNPGDAPKGDTDATIRCMQKHADRVMAALPAVKGKDTYFKARFYVIGPARK